MREYDELESGDQIKKLEKELKFCKKKFSRLLRGHDKLDKDNHTADELAGEVKFCKGEYARLLRKHDECPKKEDFEAMEKELKFCK
jgi:hypothetical protein